MSRPEQAESTPAAITGQNQNVLTGQYRSAFTGSSRLGVVFTALMALLFWFMVLMRALDGWLWWLLLAAALYLPYVLWTGVAQLRHPPRLTGSGLSFYETDPQTFLAQRREVPWTQIKGAEFQDGAKLRHVKLTLQDGKTCSLTTSTLENEQAFRAALQRELEQRGIPTS